MSRSGKKIPEQRGSFRLLAQSAGCGVNALSGLKSTQIQYIAEIA
ncbi:hypothetical protein ECRM12761_23420 [Escherichia coli O145:H28 str. RM12761]|uniref:Uncharacterized protein n=1 Tax=Escherichia coli O145:H28 (strain RM12581) TaxID=1248823 RepID=A0ABC8A0G1_ECOLR|nr:hypothetical protein ECRM13514_5063 [Escherichia coli O145:H28 str. RM13514]AHG17398.1 hypothetical protein ECRM13516_4799 [Escherichia coli O145:H28 str. RM13516]AHY67721.1 hypothetical protein ECRM12761_23420 [Escherichia coli O145:H28 str. RM12761]AHY73521.1 hypothetical protein ECRM12581_24955 [Escherichia coli O145:H28 str. RM12581]